MDHRRDRVYICLVFSAVWTAKSYWSAHCLLMDVRVLVTDRRACFSFAGNCYLTGIIFARRKETKEEGRCELLRCVWSCLMSLSS
jgi:hypothetical protein